MRRRKALIVFLMLNVALVLSCFECWREGQPLRRVEWVALFCFLIGNAVAWLGWRWGSR